MELAPGERHEEEEEGAFSVAAILGEADCEAVADTEPREAGDDETENAL